MKTQGIVHGNNVGMVWIHINPEDTFYSILPTNSSVWLPRQDQLQEMLLIDGDGHDIPYEFSEYINEELSTFGFSLTKGNDVDTFEKAWLMFTMKEFYNKQWNFKEEKWEEIK